MMTIQADTPEDVKQEIVNFLQGTEKKHRVASVNPMFSKNKRFQERAIADAFRQASADIAQALIVKLTA